MKKIAFVISNIEEYGKFVSFCINNDISVWRTYWDERVKGDICYNINWKDKKCYYGHRNFYENIGYEIIVPTFEITEYGNYKLQL